MTLSQNQAARIVGRPRPACADMAATKARGTRRISAFLTGTSGAVTVEWVTFAAFAILFGTAVFSAMQSSFVAKATAIANALAAPIQ